MPLPPFPELPDDPVKATRLRLNYLRLFLGDVAFIWTSIFVVVAGFLAMVIVSYFGVDIDPFLSWASDFVPLALAVVGIVLTLKKLNEEHHTAVIVLLVVVGIAGTLVLHLSRTHEQRGHEKEVAGLRGRMDSVHEQNDKLLQGLIAQGPQTRAEAEYQRRQNIQKALRGDYILSHKNVSPGLLAGTEFPPDDWMNRRLQELGEDWSITSSPAPKVSTPLARSYVVADGTRFPEFRDKDNKLRDDQNFQVGDELFLNFYFKAPTTNANPVSVLRPTQWLYVEPDGSPTTLAKIISDFKHRAERTNKSSNIKSDLLPGDTRWFSAIATHDERDSWYLTQSDLDDLHNGSKILFMLVEIPYLDHGQLHHLRHCNILQPPAKSPGIWPVCVSVDFNSD